LLLFKVSAPHCFYYSTRVESSGLLAGGSTGGEEVKERNPQGLSTRRGAVIGEIERREGQQKQDYQIAQARPPWEGIGYYRERGQRKDRRRPGS
jgi:hypothetical protein